MKTMKEKISEKHDILRDSDIDNLYYKELALISVQVGLAANSEKEITRKKLQKRSNST